MEASKNGSPGIVRIGTGLIASGTSALAAIAIILLLILLALGGPRLAREGIPYPPERSWLDG